MKATAQQIQLVNMAIQNVADAVTAPARSCAVALLQMVCPGIRMTALGTWAETWPADEAETRRRYLRGRGRQVRVERRGAEVTLVYPGNAPEPLVNPVTRAFQAALCG